MGGSIKCMGQIQMANMIFSRITKCECWFSDAVVYFLEFHISGVFSFLGNKSKRNVNIESEEPAKKRICVEIRDNCLIHCTETSGDLSSLQDTQSWTTLLRAAEIRQYTPILDIAKTVTGEEPPDIKYHRKCRSIFTMKRDLDKICKDANKFNESIVTERRLSMREPPTKNTIYNRVCIFCDKVSKYSKGQHVREKLVQCMDLRADESIRRIATAKNDGKILALVSRDLVAAEGCYHRSCYKAYTWHKESSTSTTSEDEESYARIESAAYEMLFDHVRVHILETPKLVRLTDLTRTMLCFMEDLGVAEAKESTKTHLRRKLEAEFGSMLQFEDLLGNSRLFVIPGTLSRLQLAKELAECLQQQQSQCKASSTEEIRRVALELRKAICSKKAVDEFCAISPTWTSSLGISQC